MYKRLRSYSLCLYRANKKKLLLFVHILSAQSLRFNTHILLSNNANLIYIASYSVNITLVFY